MPESPRKANRLIRETSPYLLQHAHNPVDWHPWGPEALEAARTQDKPIFLSIGYSACHWCHVMEHESFEDEEIAELMNRHFINIKVDREERPDLDQIYMQAVLAITGQGGWPMSVFLTPGGRPFFGGTYWPPEAKYGRAGFPQILQSVHDAWQNKRGQIDEQAGRLTEALLEETQRAAEEQTLSAELLEHAAGNLLRFADTANGGFGRAPKFPHPFDLRVLLRCWKRFDNQEALDHVVLTLDKMARGGIYDHLGGGFHRYSTDAHWLAPHFEKMLYDNALLVPAYLEAYQATGEERFADVVHETLEYVLREMTQPNGGFYSTQDADSEGEEGKFFVWTSQEIEAILGAERAKIFNACYDVTPQGNWEGKTILNLSKPLEECAEALDQEEGELRSLLAECRGELFAARQERIAPGRDEKVLVSWNGLMIAAMAMAERVLGEPNYSKAAQNAADFILKNMRTESGGLLHVYKDGEARLNAYLDDYASFLDGLVELYQATMEVRYLESALELAEHMQAQFADAEAGGFYYTSADHEELIVRQKDSQDNATPSGNAMAATALLKLGRLCGRTDLEDLAEGTLKMLSGQMRSAPAASGQALIALDFYLGKTWEIVGVDGGSRYDFLPLMIDIDDRFLPNKVIIHRPFGVSDDGISPAVRPVLQGKTAQNGRPTIYLCQHGACQAPITDTEELIRTLEQ